MKQRNSLTLILGLCLSLLLALPLYAQDRTTVAPEGAPPVVVPEGQRVAEEFSPDAFGPPPSFTSSVIGAWAFEGLEPDYPDDFTVESVAGGFGRSGVVPGCIAIGEINNVPTGARVLGMEFEACDTDPDSEICAYLYQGPSVSGFGTNEATTCTGVPFDGGCSFNGVGVGPFTIDNFNNAYWVEIRDFNTLGQGTNFRLVRILWERQISPAPGVATFSDVPTGYWAFQEIEALAASGITAGTGPGTFSPNANLTRAEMAVFLARALGLHFPG